MKNAAKWMALWALALCAALMAGCSLSLAQEDGGAGADELAGVFVRLQPDGWQDDDFFGYDEAALADYLQAHAGDFSGGDVALPDGLMSGVHVLADEERDMCLIWEHDENENGERSVGVACGPIFTDVHQAISATDAGERVDVSAVICLDAAIANGGDAMLTICPVYRRPDGALYATPANSMGGLLGGYSVTYETKAETTDVQGQKTENGLSFAVSTEKKPSLERAVLVEMGADNQALASREIDFAREELVERVSPATAWVLLEQYVTDMAPGEAPQKRVLREAISLDEGQAGTVLYLPSEQAGLLAANELTITRSGPGTAFSEGI